MSSLSVRVDRRKQAEHELSVEIATLEKKRDLILANCAGWKSCNDGSYEMALAGYNFNNVLQEIARLKAEFQK